MRAILSIVVGLCFILITSVPSFGQDEAPKAKKMEGHTWHQVVMVKYKPGTTSEAMKIINDHFMKAGMESGTPGPEIMQFKTGEWDMMMVWSMDSISEMDWEVSPDDEKWWAAMAEQEGSMEKAMEVMQKYMDMVESSTSYLATSQQPMPEKSMGSNN